MICFFWSAKSTSQQVALKLHKTAENSAAKPEKSLCEQPSCPKHAELGKSATRFKTSLRLTAAEQTTAQISSSHWVAATSDDAGKVFIQAVELRASSGMLYLPWFVTVSLAAASTGTCHMSVLIEMYNFEKNLSTLRSQLVQ